MAVAEMRAQVGFKKVLATTDFTDCSERALLAGVEFARLYGSSLHVVNVVPKEGYGVTGVGMLGAAQFARRDARELESKLLQKGYVEGIHYRISVEKGEVWPVIERFTEAEGIDLIVVGTHRRSRLSKLFVGSVAEQIFRQAWCPVLVVGPNYQLCCPVADRPRSLLFPTDFSRHAELAFRLANSLAKEQGAQLIILHVLPPAGNEATYNQDRANRYAIARLRELVASADGLAHEPECIIEVGEPAQAVVRVAAERGSNLVVLGVRSPSMFSNRLGWSTAYRIVQQSPCPVMATSDRLRWAGSAKIPVKPCSSVAVAQKPAACELQGAA